MSSATAGTLASSACACCSSSATFTGPFAAITPNSAAWPRIALIMAVRCLISRSRTPSTITSDWRSALLIGTKRIPGRLIGSQIASASFASFLPRLTYGLMYCGGSQNHLVPKPAQQLSPIMRGTTRFQPDPGRCQLVEELLHFAAPKLTAENRYLVLIDAMHLKDMLGDIQTNSDNRHETAPLAVLQSFTAWHDWCRRGPSTPTSRKAPSEQGIKRQIFTSSNITLRKHRC